MTEAQVEAATRAVEARGERVSVRRVQREMRRTPPTYRGGSNRDVLPLLKIQRVASDAEQARHDVEAMAAICREALAAPTRTEQIRVWDACEEGWGRCMRRMLAAGARGEDVTALAGAFEGLRQALEAVKGAIARRS